jgi:hypothetical protein
VVFEDLLADHSWAAIEMIQLRDEPIRRIGFVLRNAPDSTCTTTVVGVDDRGTIVSCEIYVGDGSLADWVMPMSALGDAFGGFTVGDEDLDVSPTTEWVLAFRAARSRDLDAAGFSDALLEELDRFELGSGEPVEIARWAELGPAGRGALWAAGTLRSVVRADGVLVVEAPPLLAAQLKTSS